jgi:hypothetical protein
MGWPGCILSDALKPCFHPLLVSRTLMVKSVEHTAAFGSRHANHHQASKASLGAATFHKIRAASGGARCSIPSAPPLGRRVVHQPPGRDDRPEADRGRARAPPRSASPLEPRHTCHSRRSRPDPHSISQRKCGPPAPSAEQRNFRV